jgi:hypothetical protein
LGHHSTGKTSAECYARDSLAKPLRDFELVLQQIRTKAFSPDATRSGMLSSAIVPDPKSFFQVDSAPDPKASEEADEESQSSETSSDSEESEGTDHEPDAEFQQDPVMAPRAWDSDVVMYRNLRTQVVHVVAGGCVDSLLCGVKITQDFEQVDESPFLDIRKCKRCAARKPINTVGHLASVLGASKR